VTYKSRLQNSKNHCVWPHDVQKSRSALTRRAAVLISFVLHVICAKLELQVLKVGRFSIGWFVLAARLNNDFCCFKGVTNLRQGINCVHLTDPLLVQQVVQL